MGWEALCTKYFLILRHGFVFGASLVGLLKKRGVLLWFSRLNKDLTVSVQGLRSLLWHGFDPWPGKVRVPRVWPKKRWGKKKRKTLSRRIKTRLLDLYFNFWKSSLISDFFFCCNFLICLFVCGNFDGWFWYQSDGGLIRWLWECSFGIFSEREVSPLL